MGTKKEEKMKRIENSDEQRIKGFLNGMRYINPRFFYLLTY